MWCLGGSGSVRFCLFRGARPVTLAQVIPTYSLSVLWPAKSLTSVPSVDVCKDQRCSCSCQPPLKIQNCPKFDGKNGASYRTDGPCSLLPSCLDLFSQVHIHFQRVCIPNRDLRSCRQYRAGATHSRQPRTGRVARVARSSRVAIPSFRRPFRKRNIIQTRTEAGGSFIRNYQQTAGSDVRTQTSTVHILFIGNSLHVNPREPAPTRCRL